MNPHETTRERDAAPARYRGKIIPKPALAIMDANNTRLAAFQSWGRFYSRFPYSLVRLTAMFGGYLLAGMAAPPSVGMAL